MTDRQSAVHRESHSGQRPVLYSPIPELPTVGTEYSEAQIFWIAKHGLRRSGMFAIGVWPSDEKQWTAAAYIKRLKVLRICGFDADL